MKFLASIPNALSFSRIVIAFLLLIDALDGKTGLWFVILFALASLSDALDGMIARRLGVVNSSGSEIDARADAVLYCTILFCIWRVHPAVIGSFLIPLVTLGILQAISWLISIKKFGRTTCYHSYSAKAWSISIFCAVISLFAFNYAGFLFWSLIIFGYISILEDTIITWLTPKYAIDVKSFLDALKLRNQP
ncbi:MAG: CDP-alcohol phosphatidyltransferase family protein [Candidatus Omnitrophica bacterium]|nr:CDP-alcohol phosphatidyltransferase family protein [Candidatus Omnitrophota bacterium]